MRDACKFVEMKMSYVVPIEFANWLWVESVVWRILHRFHCLFSFSSTNNIQQRDGHVHNVLGDEKFPESFPFPAKEVSFASVQLREYPMILGENPSCTSVPPVTLGWTL
jgi:hypothetical protein